MYCTDTCIQGITRYYKVLQGITMYYKVLQGITISYTICWKYFLYGSHDEICSPPRPSKGCRKLVGTIEVRWFEVEPWNVGWVWNGTLKWGKKPSNMEDHNMI